VHDFLEKLMPHVLVIAQATPVPPWVFCSLEETLVFPLQLDATTISLMAAMGLGLAAYGYPCSDESDVP
jgi:quinol-cytochrome oxidoreductase complex cytochrome b subunit